jgi:GMP synthase (glutamine-hydrolysing)
MTSQSESECVLVFDFGAQYGQLIARRVREQNVFCQIVRHDLPAERVADLKPRGLIFSGGPASVYGPSTSASPCWASATACS